jgi:TolB-like protein
MGRDEHDAATTEVDKLSPRQREVLQLLARGLTNQEIGGVLGISGETVRTHVAAVLVRLGVSNRTEAAAAHLAWDASVPRVARVLVRPAIAVLPVVALDAGARAATIAAGLTRDLVARFSRWCWFPVIANASTQDARALGATSREIGARLGARFLVDAALRSSGTQWRLTACIADSESGGCVWAEVYDFPRDALFRMQDEACRGVVAAAYPRLVSTLHAGLPRGRAGEDLDAWELAHEALVHQGAREREANLRA